MFSAVFASHASPAPVRRGLSRHAVRCLAPRCLLGAAVLAAGASAAAQQDPAGPDSPAAGQRWAVIVVGLPGDEEHAALFQQTADAWTAWLSTELQFPADHIVWLPPRLAEHDQDAPAATAEGIGWALSELSGKLGADDTLWFFTLGHGNYDGKQTWFHVPGRDPSADDFARWLRPFRCREQVLWLTHSSSGWLVKALSRPGRIVIAATAADDEENETEFPHALTAVASGPAAALDADGDKSVTVGELFQAVSREVDRRFKSDNRLPTEHAQLDDNGDGKGSEDIAPAEQAEPAEASKAKVDGALARKTPAGYRAAEPSAPPPPPETSETTTD